MLPSSLGIAILLRYKTLYIINNNKVLLIKVHKNVYELTATVVNTRLLVANMNIFISCSGYAINIIYRATKRGTSCPGAHSVGGARKAPSGPQKFDNDTPSIYTV